MILDVADLWELADLAAERVLAALNQRDAPELLRRACDLFAVARQVNGMSVEKRPPRRRTREVTLTRTGKRSWLSSERIEALQEREE